MHEVVLLFKVLVLGANNWFLNILECVHNLLCNVGVLEILELMLDLINDFRFFNIIELFFDGLCNIGIF